MMNQNDETSEPIQQSSSPHPGGMPPTNHSNNSEQKSNTLKYVGSAIGGLILLCINFETTHAVRFPFYVHVFLEY